NAVCKIDRRYFRFELETDVIFVDDGRFKVQTNTVFLELNGDGVTAATAASALNNRNRKFAAGEEAGNLAIHRDQVWLGQRTQRTVCLHGANEGGHVAAEQDQVRRGVECSRQQAAKYVTR